mgnify:FL=1|jgi:uncharacterized protein involved in response to NO
MVLLMWIVRPDGPLTSIALGVAGFLKLICLGLRAGDHTFRDRLVLILHVGYAFIPLEFLLTAASVLDCLPGSSGVHAWMAGAAGVMTLAVMTRASLSRTDQQLVAPTAKQVSKYSGGHCRA